jgi:hypothetical protein
MRLGLLTLIWLHIPWQTRIAEAQVAESLSATTARGPYELRFDLGVASPVGEAGFTASRWFFDTLAAEVGVGIGYFGLAPSLMLKLAPGRGRHRLTLGAGLSGSLPMDAPHGVTPIIWLNGEIGYQYLATTNWVFALSGGVTAGVTGTLQPFCVFPVDADCRLRDGRGIVAPTFRVGIGHRF